MLHFLPISVNETRSNKIQTPALPYANTIHERFFSFTECIILGPSVPREPTIVKQLISTKSVKSVSIKRYAERRRCDDALIE